MRLKTREEIAECVERLNQDGGEAALKLRKKMVENRIDCLDKQATSLNTKRNRIYDRIIELEIERDIIEQRLTVDVACAHCHIVFNTLPYKTPLMEGKVFCSRACALSELANTIGSKEV